MLMLLHIPAGAVGGDDGILRRPVALSVSNRSIGEVFAAIGEQTGAVFSYDPRLFNVSQKVSLHIDAPVADVLKRLLPSCLTFKATGVYVILHAPPKPLPVAATPAAVAEEPPAAPPRSRRVEGLKKMSLLSRGEIRSTCHSGIIFKHKEAMKKQTISFSGFFAALLASITPAAAQPPAAMRPFQLSLVYPVGTDGVLARTYTYGCSVNLLGGCTGGVQGAEFAGIYNVTAGNVQGAQFAGVLNATKGYVQGAQFAGVINIARRSGVQAAGVANAADSSGVQLAGVVNIARKGGVQIAGVANAADSSCTQLAGVVNITRRGGFQLGLVNVRDTADGYQLGLVNIVRRGGLLEVEAAAGDAGFLPATVSFRSGHERLYAVLAVGRNFNAGYWACGAGLGTTFRLSSRVGVQLEGMHYSLTNGRFRLRELNMVEQLRPLVYWQVSPHFALFAGPTANLYIGSQPAENGLQVHIPYAFSGAAKTMNTADTRFEVWAGGTAGVRIRF